VIIFEGAKVWKLMKCSKDGKIPSLLFTRVYATERQEKWKDGYVLGQHNYTLCILPENNH